MSLALVLLNVESSLENDVLQKVKEIDGVEEGYISYGVYDIVVKVRAKSMDALKDLITTRLRQLENVRATLSLILIEE
jgi:DNA-binding Lrp family transcriptional regulator